MAAKTKLTFEGQNRTQRAFTQIGNSLGNLKGRLSGVTAGARSFVAVLGAAAAIRFGKKIIDETDELAKMSRQLGVSTKDLSEYTFVATQAGVSAQGFATSIQRIRRRAEEATEGVGSAVDTFRALNIDAAKFVNLSLADQMRVLAVKFEEAEAGAAGLKEAFKLLDTEGVENLRFLREGPVALEAYRRKAEELGVTLDEFTAKKTEAFTNSLGELGAKIKSVARGGLILLDEKVRQVGDGFTAFKEWATSFGAVNKVVDAGTSSWRFYEAGVGAAADALDDAREKANAAANAVKLAATSFSPEELQRRVELLRAIGAQVKRNNQEAAGGELDKLLEDDDLFGFDTVDQDRFSGLSFAIEDAIRAGGAAGGKGLVEALLQEVERNLVAALAKSIASAFLGATGGGGGVFGKLFGFAQGGTVPGPKGAPQLAVVHGGETVTPPGGGFGGVTINQTINAQGANNPAEVRRAVQAGQRETIAAVSDLLRRGKIGR